MKTRFIHFSNIFLALPKQNGQWILNSEPADPEEEVETSNFGMLRTEGQPLVLPVYTLLENSMASFLCWTLMEVEYVASRKPLKESNLILTRGFLEI